MKPFSRLPLGSPGRVVTKAPVPIKQTVQALFLGMVALLLVIILGIGPVQASENTGDKKDKPARGVVAALRFPGITLGPDDKVRVDYIVKNSGRSDETVMLQVLEMPEGWNAQFKMFGDIVSGVFVGEDEKQTLTFSAGPEGEDEKLKPGVYRFKVKARTEDGSIEQTSALEVKVVEKAAVEEKIAVTTSYPVLRGPSDAQFEFSLDVSNELDEDALFNLRATPPEGWEISFSPAYESKQISSLQIKANQNKSVSVNVKPARSAEAGEYPFKVAVQTSKAKEEVELIVVLTGTYKLKVGTLDGLLSVATQKGKPASMSVYIRNEGSALQRQIEFLSFKPENWDVKFKPERVENLKSGDLAQVEVEIIPSPDALVGDYSVAMSVKGEKVSDEAEFRVTVNASAAWGFVGVAIIILVILGLAIVFKKLGRR